MTLHGKRILITGAAGGLGTATIQALREQGAAVAGIDKVSGDSAFTDEIFVADITDPEVVRQTVISAIQALGGLDILINNAGTLSLQDAGATPGADVEEAMAVNLLGTWRVTAAALPALIESHGRVINVASLFAVVNAPFIPGYAASKRALIAYSDILRFQYGDRISVTTVYPGYMRTPIHAEAERQGLSVARIVTFRMGNTTILSMEESLAAAARGLVRVCAGRPGRDRGLTFMGTLTLLAARYLPGLIDTIVGWRLKQLVHAGALQVQLD